MPVPLNAIAVVPPLDESLLMASWPVAAPAVVGLNWICSVFACVGLKVTGKLAPDTVKPVPASVAALIVTGAVPDEVNVTACVDAEFTVTLPKLRLTALTDNCGIVAARTAPLNATTAVLPLEESLLIAS